MARLLATPEALAPAAVLLSLALGTVAVLGPCPALGWAASACAAGALILSTAAMRRSFRLHRVLADERERLKAAGAALAAEEARLALFMRHASDGIWEWDQARDQWYFSPAFRNLLGYQDEASFNRGFQFWNCLHEDDQEKLRAASRDCREGRAPKVDQEVRLRGRDGFRWFRCRTLAVPGKGGQCPRLAGTISDVSARKLLEKELAASQERQSAAVQTLSEGLWDWDVDSGRFHYSRRFREMLGYREEELPRDQAAYLLLVHPDDRTRVEVEWLRHFQERRPFDSEHRLLMADGSHHWFRTRGQAVWHEDGQVRSFSAAVSDISLHRRALDNIRTLLAENQALLDNALVGIAQTRNQVFFGCNHRFEEMFGYGYGEVVDQPMDIVFPSPLAAAELRAAAGPALARGERYTAETELRRKDGSALWCLASGHASRPDRPEEGCIWVFADLSLQQRAMAAVRRERDFSNALIDHLPGVFCLLDEYRRIIRWNANFERQSGFSAREILQLTWDRLFPEDVRTAAEGLMQDAWNTGSATGQIALMSKSGARNPHLFNCVRVEVDGEDNLALIGMDVTERERAVEQVRTLNADLERRVETRTAELARLNQELESFSYSVSHDLSTPLRGVEGFSRILETDYGPGLDELARNYLHRIRTAALRMQQLIDDLLALSRASRDEMRRQPCDLAAIARPILADLHYHEPRRAVTDIVPASISATGDPRLLTIVMENLLRNAWKFTSGHKTARIEMGQLDKQDGPVYFVRDDGAGFDMENATRLFGTFQRLHHASQFPGTGIGLAIVARIIHRHGGHIWAESAVEEGATFYFTLPHE